MNDLRKRAEDLLTRVELTPQAVDAMVAFAAERVAAERDASKENAERNKWMCEAMQEEIARLREDAERYRWLRSWVNRMDDLEAMNLQEPKSPEEADAIIDAARKDKP